MSANTYLPGVVTIPSSLVIVAITRAFPMVITVVVNSTTESMSYIPGQIIKLNIPFSYGMQQANGMTVEITAINSLNISVNVDSTNFDVFAIPSSTAQQPASIAPAGSRNLQYNNSTNAVGFQALNNIGN